ncbi:MAG: HipA domain-containing protein [Spirochaetales bacterium]
MSKCLVCFGDLRSGDYHPSCALRLFDTRVPLEVDLNLEDLPSEGLRLLEAKGGIAGVQKKLSLGRSTGQPGRLTVVGFQGRFILKPPSPEFEALPENEALCMELGNQLGLGVAGHGLVRLKDGTLAYLSRRFDRPDDQTKWHQEDFCQLAERPVADKYKGSLEAAGNLLRYSRQPGLDAVRFLELGLFCWLTGNADMHLKNFSLLLDPTNGWILSPAYDLVSTRLVLPEDNEETALPINGKKSHVHWRDWEALAANLGVEGKVAFKLAARLASKVALVEDLARRSMLPTSQQEVFVAIYRERAARLARP